MISRARKAATEVLNSFGYKVPLDIHALVSQQGIEVQTHKMERLIPGMMVTTKSAALITLNESLPLNQQRFVLAHLLGHFVLHGKSADVFVDRTTPITGEGPEIRKRIMQENEANEFAGELLMPEAVVRDRFETSRPYPYNLESLRPLAAQFGINEFVLAIRLTQLGLAA